MCLTQWSPDNLLECDTYSRTNLYQVQLYIISMVQVMHVTVIYWLVHMILSLTETGLQIGPPVGIQYIKIRMYIYNYSWLEFHLHNIELWAKNPMIAASTTPLHGCRGSWISLELSPRRRPSRLQKWYVVACSFPLHMHVSCRMLYTVYTQWKSADCGAAIIDEMRTNIGVAALLNQRCYCAHVSWSHDLNDVIHC